jgi:hypothetical protein
MLCRASAPGERKPLTPRLFCKASDRWLPIFIRLITMNEGPETRSSSSKKFLLLASSIISISFEIFAAIPIFVTHTMRSRHSLLVPQINRYASGFLLPKWPICLQWLRIRKKGVPAYNPAHGCGFPYKVIEWKIYYARIFVISQHFQSPEKRRNVERALATLDAVHEMAPSPFHDVRF